MKTLNSLKLIAISSVASLVLVGCGGSTGGVNSQNSIGGTTISGVAIDPEIQGANVYLDINENGVYDEGEFNTTTDEYGKFSLTIPDEYMGKPLVVEGGIDRVTKEDFRGRLEMISDANRSEHFITPLSTLVKQYRDNNPDKPLSELKDELATKLGLASTDELDKNTLKDTKLLKIALRLHKVAQRIADASGKDIREIYKKIAKRLRNKGFDRSIDETINEDVNRTSLDYERVRDLDREIKRVDDAALGAEELALSIDNIDANITHARTKKELDIDIYNNVNIIIVNPKQAKDFKAKKVLARLGLKDLDDDLKQKILSSDKLDFDNDMLAKIKEKIANNRIGLNDRDKKRIGREKLFQKIDFKKFKFAKKLKNKYGQIKDGRVDSLDANASAIK